MGETAAGSGERIHGLYRQKELNPREEADTGSCR
jgi:hypothetical protein